MRLVVLAVVAACGGAAAPACPLAPRVASPAPFLWKAQRAGGAPVWFYGTIHNAGGSDVPKVAWAALEASPRFLSEVGDVEPDRDKTIDLARLPPGKGLDALLPSDDWYDLRDTMRGTIKEDDLKRARPWYAMARLTAKLAPPASPTMDVALAERARARKIPVDPLESIEAQLAALAETVQVRDLQEALHARKTVRCELDTMRSIYQTGDLPAMERLLLIPATEKLRVERSKAWLPKIEPLFASGGFVAVGLGHLAGDQGIPAMLARAGYTVQRVMP
ncbi:MAG: TraB/GumN family protein [Kofleriaceae bacterium]